MPWNHAQIADGLTTDKLQIKLNPQPGLWTLLFTGSLGFAELAATEKYLHSFLQQPNLPPTIVFDLAGLTYMDSAGALILLFQEKTAQQKGVKLEQQGLTPELKRIKDLIRPEDLAKPPLLKGQRHTSFLETLGTSTFNLMRDVYQVLDFFGQVIAFSAQFLFKPGIMRWRDMLFQMQQVGVGGVPIIGLIGLLLGMILAFMSLLQLEPFGASIYVASLVSVAMVKELGPIMTAILVAGRSGSAFAAEIGSMKENEELDALQVMGYSPVLFLAMPRIVATVLVVPLLGMFANILGILGGLLVGVAGMGLGISSYVEYSLKSLSVSAIVISSVKLMVFAFLIAGIGCQRGFMVRGGSSAVGQATTSSVVASIFLIIVVDSIFAIVQQYARW